MNYQKYVNSEHYSYPELVRHVKEVQNFIPNVKVKWNAKSVELYLNVKPTEASREYSIKLVAKQKIKSIDVYVIDPQIDTCEDGRKVPHMYPKGTLCLFYPNYKEWNYYDSWVKTIIPWTTLWLFYYEIWKETGEWVGGGIHDSKVSTKKRRKVLN